ncbi:hypothetical protein MSTO_58050 [Mycobacterium stomatepiae]|uniref:Uncharacterized protein n=1 Tax=Mycobacterium stomatepiae TaxID=470076 RepID=A0A7I7QHK5_9MYCO|nr:hypothetical protein MSTO_58050 [Mycobacterium stomatepiae]
MVAAALDATDTHHPAALAPRLRRAMNMSRDTLRKITAVSLVLTLVVASFLVVKKLWKDVEKNT